MNNDRLLTVKGDRLVDATGKTVTLRGYNIGGFLNMENFLTGFPSTESLQRGALVRALGERRYDLYFDRFMQAFFSDDDARYLASLGMNHFVFRSTICTSRTTIGPSRRRRRAFDFWTA
jgi:hypothetical protein